jgi:opacity protein-like surface antigen
MKRVSWLMPAILLFCATAKAQESTVPAWDIYGGYTYVRANLGGTSFNMNGGGASATQNLNDWFGGRVEFSDVGATVGTRSNAERVNAQTITYGPVFTYRKFNRLAPYAHVQLGAVHASQGFLGISEAAFKFAASAGGGVDYAVSDRIAVRVQGDYLMTRFLDRRQDNVQLTAGLVFRIGTK